MCSDFDNIFNFKIFLKSFDLLTRKASNNVIRSQENPSYDENVVLMNNEPDRNVSSLYIFKSKTSHAK